MGANWSWEQNGGIKIDRSKFVPGVNLKGSNKSRDQNSMCIKKDGIKSAGAKKFGIKSAGSN